MKDCLTQDDRPNFQYLVGFKFKEACVDFWIDFDVEDVIA